jgi:hypothetical protein
LLLRDAPEIEISVQVVFVGPDLIHERKRDALRQFLEASNGRGFVAHEDAEKNRRSFHHVFSKGVVNANHIRQELFFDLANRGLNRGLITKPAAVKIIESFPVSSISRRLPTQPALSFRQPINLARGQTSPALSSIAG